MPLTNYLDALRYNQIFGDGSFPDYTAPQVPSMNVTGPSPTPNMSPMSMGMGYAPEHQASDYLTSTLGQMPTRPEPSMLAKIFAGIAGAGGPQMAPTQERILSGGFEDDMKDWLTRYNAANQAAQMERQNNIAGRQAFDTSESRKITQQRADEYVRRGDTAEKEQASKEADRQRKADLDQRKQTLAEFKARNPNFIYKTDKKGRIYAFNPSPTAGQPPIDTGIDSGDLGDLEKHNLKLDEIVATGDQARETEGTRQEGRIALENLRQMKPIPSHTTTTEINPEGNKRTTTTTTEAPRFRVKAPDGQTGTWPANKPLPPGFTRIQ